MPITGLDRMPGTGLARGTLFDKDLNTTNIVSSNLTSTNSIILEKASENSYTINWTQPSGADRILSIPAMSSADTFAFLAATQTFTNKTLTAPTISGGTVTAITDLDMTVGNKTILDTIGSNTLTIGAGGTTVVIAGNLTVSGATTTTVSNTLLVEDSLYVLNHGETGTPSEDSGFVVERGDDTNVGFIWDESADEFVVINTSSTGTETGNVTIASYANLQVATAQMSALNIGGTAVTSTAAEINLIDGGTARGTTAIADGDGVLINDSGTMRMTTVETLAAYLDDEITAMPNVTTLAGLTTIGAVANTLAMTFGDVTLYDDNNNADVSFKMGTGANESLTIQVLNGGSNKTAEEVHFSTATASGTGDHGKMVFDVDGTDILTIDDGGLVIKTTGTIGPVGDEDLLTLTASGSIVTVAGELSVTTLDIGGTNVTATATEINLIDGGTARGTTSVASGDGILINDGGTMRMTNVDTVSTYFASHSVGGSNIVTTGALNSGSITSGFGTINNGSSAISTTGTITYGSLSDGTISVTAWADEDDMSSDSATLVPTQQSVKAYVDNQQSMGSGFVMEDGDGTEVTITESKEMKFVEGGGIDINWTDTDNGTDADPYDLTFTINAAQTDITSLLATDIKIGEDDQTKIDFEDANTINFYANNAKDLVLSENALTPGTSDGTALGTTSLMWSDLFVASGGVLNFNNGDMTVTHSSNALTVAGGTLATAALTATTFVASSTVDIQSYASIGGSASSASTTLIVDRDFSASGGASQMQILGNITFTGGSSNARYLGIGGYFGGGVIVNSGGTHGKIATVELDEPNITETSGSVSHASTLYIAAAATEATNNWAIWVDGGICRLDGGTIIGATTSTNNLIDDASTGSGATTLYIGNTSITTSSDRRIKKDIVDTEVNAVDILDKLRVVDFMWNDPTDIAPNNRNMRGQWTGMIAQEAVDVVPYIINAPRTEDGDIDYNDESTWMVDYQHLVPMLVKAIQELKHEIEELKGGN